MLVERMCVVVVVVMVMFFPIILQGSLGAFDNKISSGVREVARVSISLLLRG
jgi:hypothetical protein